MASYDYGKTEVVSWIREHFAPEAEILDVGACDGKWKSLLPEYNNMDAVGVFPPNVYRHELGKMYRLVYVVDIADFNYKHYDLVIFGDVIEHMTPEKAAAVLDFAKQHSDDMVIGVPWLYHQDPLYGNEYERHIQEDLTLELFRERYPGFEILFDTGKNYCYFHKKE